MRLFPGDHFNEQENRQQPSQSVVSLAQQSLPYSSGVLVLGQRLCPKNNTDIDKCIGFGTV